jgi:hypothetical protein
MSHAECFYPEMRQHLATPIAIVLAQAGTLDRN